MGDALLGKSVGHYRLVKPLGVGGMGAVYLGEHPEIESRVAIKVLLPRFVENPQITRRFLDEARAVNRIGHHGIVRIHDSGRQEDVGVYLVMELLEGRTLDEELRAQGPLDEERVVRLLRQTASALAASHQAGIIHRDLKPSNLFLVSDPEIAGGERVKILDFGIAKLLEDRDPKHREATQTGMVMGSLLFMSPEQCLDTKRVDARSDIYSLGAIGYQLLTGAYPFDAESVGQLVLKHQRETPAPIASLNPAVSARLAEVLHRALAVDPEARFASMNELRDALGAPAGEPLPSAAPRPSLHAVASAETVLERPRGTTTLSSTAGELVGLGVASGRRRLIVGASLAVVLVGGGLLVWRTIGRGPEPDPGPAATVSPRPDRGAHDAGARAPGDLAARVGRAPDLSRTTPVAHGKKKREPKGVKLMPAPAPTPAPSPPPAPDARPKGTQDVPKKDEKKPYFDEDL
jgi:serine/threonine-protein kinase